MSTFALDANIISYLLKGDKGIAAHISEETAKGNDVIIPPIAYYEVKRGLLTVDATKKMQTFERLCARTAIGEIDREVLDIAANVHAALRRAGRPVEDADILIAAFCIRNIYTLVTNNVKHFDVIDGLKYVNWI